MTKQERFGRVLRQLRREKAAREERDVDQGEVAKAVGDTQPNVAKWEGGRVPKDDATVKRLAAFYGVNWIWLLHGEGERNIRPPEPVERATIGSVDGVMLEDPADARPGTRRAVGQQGKRGRGR